MQSFVDIHLKQDALARYGLPDIAYPIPTDSLHQVVSATGDLPLAMLLSWFAATQPRRRKGLEAVPDSTG